MYGVVPTEVAKGPTIETITLRQTYDFYDWNIMNFYIGLNAYHVLGLKYQSSHYGNSPENYYPIGSIRGLLNLGTSIAIDKHQSFDYYFETGINDIWITNYLNNVSTINPLKHFSMALGFKKFF